MIENFKCFFFYLVIYDSFRRLIVYAEAVGFDTNNQSLVICYETRAYAHMLMNRLVKCQLFFLRFCHVFRM